MSEKGKEMRDRGKEVIDSSNAISHRENNAEIGFNSSFPKAYITKFDVTHTFKQGGVPKVTTNRRMLVVAAPKDPYLKDKFEYGDWVAKVNDVAITSRSHYNEQINKLNRAEGPQTVKWTVRRPIRYVLIEDPAKEKLIPVATEIQPGYNYYKVCVMLHPGSTLGLNIKSVNSKVFVTATDNSYNCASFYSLLVGDAILAVEKAPVSNIVDASAKMKKALKARSYVILIVERPRSNVARNQVRLALYMNKTREVDPPLPQDVVQICREEVKRLRALKEEPDAVTNSSSSKSKQKHHQHVQIMKTNLEVTIGTNPINPEFLHNVPPRP